MTLDPQAQALLQQIEASGSEPMNELSPTEARLLYDAAAELLRGSPPQPHSIDSVAIPGPDSTLQSRLYRPSAAQRLPLLVYFHGGGYTIGSLDSHDSVCRSLCVEADCLVISVDYRLAPEHKYPAAIEDAWAATRWLASHAAELGADPSRLAVAGDSAGGNLAAVVCLMAKAAGEPKIDLQLLIYPGIEMTCAFKSHQSFGSDYRLTRELIAWFYGHYFSTQDDKTQWQASPINAPDLAGLPPAFILTAGYDPLQDEAKAYADKLALAGVAVKHSHYAGMIHGFITMPGAIDKAGEALTECADELRRAFSA